VKAFPWNSIDDNRLKELSIGLKSLSTLSESKLEVYQNYEISDKGFFALSQGFKYLKSLSPLPFTLALVLVSKINFFIIFFI